VSLLGLIERPSPVGVLDADRLTVPEKPLRLFIMMLDVVGDPSATDRSTGLAETEKSEATRGPRTILDGA
jgi:hypothetical protein